MNEVKAGQGVGDDAVLVPRRDFLVLGSSALVGAVTTSAAAHWPQTGAVAPALSVGWAGGTLDEIRSAGAPLALTSAARLGSANRLRGATRLNIHGIVRAERPRAEFVDLDALYHAANPSGEPLPVHAWSDRRATAGGNHTSRIVVPVTDAPLTLALTARLTPTWSAAVAHRFFGAAAPKTEARATATLVRDGVYFVAIPAAGEAQPNWASIRVVPSADGKLPQLTQSSLLGNKPVSFDYIVLAAEQA